MGCRVKPGNDDGETVLGMTTSIAPIGSRGATRSTPGPQVGATFAAWMRRRILWHLLEAGEGGVLSTALPDRPCSKSKSPMWSRILVHARDNRRDHDDGCFFVGISILVRLPDR